MYMQPKLSYLIAVYNGEKYLRQCIDSLYNQNLPEDDFEVICIDDCSSDGSVHILQEYAAQHSNMRIILHTKNMRTSNSGNEGLQVAKGKYMTFIGQDDWLEKGWGEKLVRMADEEQLDILPFNYNRVNADGTAILSNVEVFKNSRILNGKKFIKTYFYDTIGIYLLGYEWRAIYRRQYLLDNNIVFPKDMLFEDTTFMFKAIWNAQRIQSISDYIYNYRLNNKSVTNFAQRYKGYLTYEFSFKTSEEILSLADVIEDEHIAEQLRKTALRSLKSFGYKIIPMSNAEKRIFYDNLESERDEVQYLCDLLPWNYRLMLHPSIGKWVVMMLKPVFYIKHLFIKRNYANR